MGAVAEPSRAGGGRVALARVRAGWRRPAFAWAMGLVLGCGAAAADPVQRAIALAGGGHPREALVLLDRAERPVSLRHEQLRLRLCAQLGDMAGVSESFERLAERSAPGNPLPWLELGRAYELSHAYEEALLAYDRAASSAPADPAGPKTGGRRAARWGRFDWAEPRLREALRRRPGDAEAWHALGFVLQSTGRLHAARAAYEHGLERDPARLDNRLGLATVALRQGRPARALHHYRALVEARPGYVEGWLGVSWASIALHRFREAQEALTEASRRGASPAVVGQQRRWMQNEQARGAARPR